MIKNIMENIEFQHISSKAIYNHQMELELSKEDFLIDNDVFEYILKRFPNYALSEWKIKINGNEFYGF
jgi:hypothetical protein